MNRVKARWLQSAWLTVGCLLWSLCARAATEDLQALEFDDFPLEEPLEYPDWFKQSFLDLPEELAESLENGKKGLIVYFGQRRCAYCKMLLEVNFRLPDVVAYTRRNFDVIPIDIWGIDEVTDLEGKVLTEREYAVRENTNFTPSLLFFDQDGKLALKLRGYYPPYTFRAALEYVVDGYYRREPFQAYLERANPPPTFEPEALNEEPFFSGPPFNLDRTRLAGERPLVVFFEQGECHACDILHSQPLKEAVIARHFNDFETVQLDIWSDTPVITPQGQRTTAREWAKELGIFYTPSIVFFDEQGHEIIRVDSVVHFYRLRNVLNYVTSRGYLSEPSYQRWRVSSGF